jgi:hypothetical protein
MLALAAGSSRAATAPGSGEPLPEDEALAPPSWDACGGGARQGPYFLGRYAHNVAVVEVGSSHSAALARLWSHAKPGGSAVTWPGGRLGVRHLQDPRTFAQASPLAEAGRLYLWEELNKWGDTLAPITGVELAKSLCEANSLVVYLVLKFDQPGEGYVVAAVNPPETGEPGQSLVDPPKDVMNRLYAGLLGRLRSGLHAQKLVPSQTSMSILPGHFTGSELEYVVSLKWTNGFDDRFSLVCLADQEGNLRRVVDKQEGGAGGVAVEVADLAGGKPEELIYELTTLDGSLAALWSLKDGKLTPLVQTTPVGE